MSYTLSTPLCCCVMDGIAVLVDTGSDRSFRLPLSPQRAFCAMSAGEAISDDDAAALLRRNIPREFGIDVALPSAATIVTVRRSALECDIDQAGGSTATIQPVFMTVTRPGIELRIRRLTDIIDTLARYRQRPYMAGPGSGRLRALIPPPAWVSNAHPGAVPCFPDAHDPDR